MEFASTALKAGSTYQFEFQISYLDLQTSNFPLSVLFTGTYESGGHLRIINVDNEANTTLKDITISDPDESTTVAMLSNGFMGVAGSHFGTWTIKGIVKPSTNGTLSIEGAQNAASIEHLFYSVPTMTVS